MLFSCELRSPMEMRFCHTRHNFWLSGAAARGRRRQKTVEAAPVIQKCIGLNRLDGRGAMGIGSRKRLRKGKGESEDKLRQSVEFRCAGRIECLLGRRGLRVVGASRERASPKRVETLPSTPA